MLFLLLSNGEKYGLFVNQKNEDDKMSYSDIKVLLLNVNRMGWHSGNMIYDMEVIFRGCDTTPYGPGWPEYKNTDIREIIKQIYGDGKPDIIYSYFTPGEVVRDAYIQHYNIPNSLRIFPTHLDKVDDVVKIFGLSDFWARKPQQFAKDLAGSTFQYCFCCFTPPYSNPNHFYAFFNEQIRKEIKFIAHPRCIDKDCFKDYGLPKKYDVITLGAMWRFYSLRVHMHRHLSTNQFKLGIKYHNYPHCGTDFHHSNFVRENYARAINQARMLASCGGRYRLAMNKIFEAMACGTVYVGEKPYGEEQLHLCDGFNYVAITKDNFVDKIKFYLDRPEEIKRIVDNAKETFQKYHHIDARAHDFVQLLQGILQK